MEFQQMEVKFMEVIEHHRLVIFQELVMKVCIEYKNE